MRLLGELHARLNATATRRIEKSDLVGLGIELLAALLDEAGTGERGISIRRQAGTSGGANPARAEEMLVAGSSAIFDDLRAYLRTHVRAYGTRTMRGAGAGARATDAAKGGKRIAGWTDAPRPAVATSRTHVRNPWPMPSGRGRTATGAPTPGRLTSRTTRIVRQERRRPARQRRPPSGSIGCAEGVENRRARRDQTDRRQTACSRSGFDNRRHVPRQGRVCCTRATAAF